MYKTELNGIKLELETADGLFSPSGADSGTLAMLSLVRFSSGERVLDLGCGCGIVGIYASKFVGAENVIMCDIDPEAVKMAKKNAIGNGVPDITAKLSNGFSEISGSFDVILSNPPYHTDFSVAKSFIEGAYKALSTGGRIYMVTKRLDWYKNKLTSVFGGVRVYEVDGYFVFVSEKRAFMPKKPEKKKGGISKKLARKKSLKK